MESIQQVIEHLHRLPPGWLNNVIMISRMTDPDANDTDYGRWIISLSHILPHEIQGSLGVHLAYLSECNSSYAHTVTSYWRYGDVLLATTEIPQRHMRHMRYVEES